MPLYITKPRIFGEMGILKKNKKIYSKLEKKGQVCIFVGYNKDHAPDTYRLFVIDTKRIVKSRDILWTNEKLTINEPNYCDKENNDIDTDKWIEDEDEKDSIMIVPNQNKINLGESSTIKNEHKKRQQTNDSLKGNEASKKINERRQKEEQDSVKRVRINDIEDIINETEENKEIIT